MLRCTVAVVGPLGAMVGVMVSGCDVCFFKVRRGWVRVLSQAEEVMLRSVCMVLVVGSHQGTGGCYVIVGLLGVWLAMWTLCSGMAGLLKGVGRRWGGNVCGVISGFCSVSVCAWWCC